MPLHLQQHKSYHPYSSANIARVRADEEAAERAEAERLALQQSREAEGRRELLRAAAQGQQGTAKGKERALEDDEGDIQAEEGGRRKRVSSSDAASDAREQGGKYDSAGHINFWADLERDETRRNLDKVREG